MREKLGVADICGVEVNPALAGLARRRAGVDVRNREYEPGLFGRRFDLATCTKVLEHIPDPLKFLAGLAQDLTAEGLLLLVVPDISDLYTLPPDHKRFNIYHYHYFSANTLTALLARAGLEAVDHETTIDDKKRAYLQLLARKTGKVFAPPPPYDDPGELAEKVAFNLKRHENQPNR